MRIATNTMEVATLKIFCPAVIGFAASLVEEMKEMKEIFIPLGEAISALSAISVGLLASHADSFYCPTEIKEIKEILLPPPSEALSAISALSAGHYYLMRIVFYCPAEMKEMKEIQVSDVALGRPSASKLQGQELQKVK